MSKTEPKIEEMLTGWDMDKKHKYLCFYHKAFPFMNDSWGMDCSDSKEELLEKQWPLFSVADINKHAVCDEVFSVVLNAIADDPQLVLCSEGKYRICRYSNSNWGWVGTPTNFSKDLWKKLSSLYRMNLRRGHTPHRDHMIALDDSQFETAQRLVREVYGGEIATHERKDEF